MGNLVGLATPLTSVSPVSGHFVSEAIDLLISVWSMALAGLVIGVIANLTFVTLVVNASDRGIIRRVGSLLVSALALRVEDLAKDVDGMTLEEFGALVSSSGLRLPVERIAQIFAEADADHNGTIDKVEARVVVAKLRDEAKRSEDAAPSDPRVDELLATVAKLQASLEGLHAKLDKS